MAGIYAGQFVMEGFLDIKLRVYQRVVLTRAVAIAPALYLTFIRDDFLTLWNLEIWLNLLQSIQIPLALVPLLKFAGSETIMKEFKASRCQLAFAWVAGFLLWTLNLISATHDISE